MAGLARRRSPIQPEKSATAPKITTVSAMKTTPRSAICSPTAAGRRVHELRQEGEEEERHLRVERVADHALPEDRRERPSAPLAACEREGRAMAERLDADPHEVGRARVAHDVEGEGEERMSAATPSAASAVWKRQPVAKPSAAAKPALRPWLMPRVST